MAATATASTGTKKHNPIENYTEAIHGLVRHTWLRPDGSEPRVEMDDPQRLDRRDSEYLRVSVPRKGLTFKVIEEAEQHGLKVADVWQHDADKDDDRIMLKVEPKDE